MKHNERLYYHSWSLEKLTRTITQFIVITLPSVISVILTLDAVAHMTIMVMAATKETTKSPLPLPLFLTEHFYM
mgnify:CR=1 FL=1